MAKKGWVLDDITQKDLVREGLGNSFIHVMCYKMPGNHVVCNELSCGTGVRGVLESFEVFYLFIYYTGRHSTSNPEGSFFSFFFSLNFCPFFFLRVVVRDRFWTEKIESWNYFPVLLGQGPFELYHLVPTLRKGLKKTWVTLDSEGLGLWPDLSNGELLCVLLSQALNKLYVTLGSLTKYVSNLPTQKYTFCRSVFSYLE